MYMFPTSLVYAFKAIKGVAWDLSRSQRRAYPPPPFTHNKDCLDSRMDGIRPHFIPKRNVFVDAIGTYLL